VTVRLVFVVGADQLGNSLSNTATITSPSDPSPASAATQAVVAPTVVEQPPDLALTLSPPAQTLTSGSTASLTATITNLGPGTATGVVVALDIPPGVSAYSGAAVTWPAGRAQPPDGVVGSLTFDVGTLAPGETVTYRVVGTVSGAPGEVLSIAGSAVATESEAVSANNAASATVSIVGATGVAVGAGGFVAEGSTTARWWLAIAAAVLVGAAGGLVLLWRRNRGVARPRHFVDFPG
jgi:uncharacterized repeat protein (TIGR01451 family)